MVGAAIKSWAAEPENEASPCYNIYIIFACTITCKRLCHLLNKKVSRAAYSLQNRCTTQQQQSLIGRLCCNVGLHTRCECGGVAAVCSLFSESLPPAGIIDTIPPYYLCWNVMCAFIQLQSTAKLASYPGALFNAPGYEASFAVDCSLLCSTASTCFRLGSVSNTTS